MPISCLGPRIPAGAATMATAEREPRPLFRRAPGPGRRIALSRPARHVPARAHPGLQHGRPDHQRRRHRRRDCGRGAAVRGHTLASSLRGCAGSGRLARLRRGHRADLGGERPRRCLRPFRWLECQWQRAGRRLDQRGRSRRAGHRRAGGRWRELSANARRRRLRTAQAHGRSHRFLWAVRAHRPRQRRRLGRVRTAAADHALARQRAVRARRRTRARSLRALSRRGRCEGTARHRPPLPAAHPQSRSGPITTSCARSWASTTRPDR